MRFLLPQLVMATVMVGVVAVNAGEIGVRWSVRPLIVFAPDDAAADAQTVLLDAPDALSDLKLAVYVVTGDAVTPRFGAPEPGSDAAALRRRFSVGQAEFRVVLVGLDGGAKFTTDRPVTLQQLTGTIDAMPMRRNELRRRT